VITYAAAGNYTVSLTTTNSSGCQSATAHIISITPTGLNAIADKHLAINFDGRQVNIHFDAPANHARIRIYDSIGKLIIDEEYNGGSLYSIPTTNISSELLLVNVEEEGKSYSKKITVTQ
jgi:PKD repeat protein